VSDSFLLNRFAYNRFVLVSALVLDSVDLGLDSRSVKDKTIKVPASSQGSERRVGLAILHLFLLFVY